MIDDRTIFTGLYPIIDGLVSCPVILVEQKAPRPTERPYLAVSINGFNMIGGEELGVVDGTGSMDLSIHGQLTIEFTAYGTGAKSVINQVQLGLNRPSVVDAMDAIGLAVVGTDNILDIPAIRDTIWEETCRLNATFFHRVTDTDAVGVIETVTVNGEVEGNVNVDPIAVTVSVTVAP